MAQIPAFCPRCGAIFGSGYYFDDVRELSLAGNEAQCTVCGHMGEVPDGVFNVTDGVLEVLSAPAITRERLQRLQSILESVNRGSMGALEAVEQLEQEAPELGSFLARLK